MKTMVALLQREVQEHRAFWLVPSIMAALSVVMVMWVFVYVIPHTVGYELWVDKLWETDLEDMERIGYSVFAGIAAPFVVMMVFVMFFYLLDSLYSERRDRSILFWKSLPITDTETVFSKLLAGLVVFPVIVLLIVTALTILLALLTGIFVLFGGGNPWELVWQHFDLFGGFFRTALGIFVEVLWYLPLFAWVMLASAWAKKAPFLWTILPPLAIIWIENVFLDTDWFTTLLADRLQPFGHDMFSVDKADHIRMFGGNIGVSNMSMNLEAVGVLFTSAGFWVGAVVAAIFTAGAIWMRRYRDES